MQKKKKQAFLQRVVQRSLNGNPLNEDDMLNYQPPSRTSRNNKTPTKILVNQTTPNKSPLLLNKTDTSQKRGDLTNYPGIQYKFF